MKILFVLLIFALASSGAEIKSYRIMSERATWIESVHYCRRMGGELVVIESQDELNRLSNYLQNQGYGESDLFWTSGNDYISRGKFYSITTGNLLPFTEWCRGQPDNYGGNERCVHLYFQDGSYKMNDLVCEDKAKAICERYVKTYI
ncbi:C-type lectin 37Db-like [Drosophila albomicans]|uniref:C-type lectin 37Db-like n=1 Tax=Drosophila albomicans TaxID=7291 RepID=A0A6P8ZDY2_DROAB|nr:C-type lectin 37Db-like [Drosophila albomicans]